MGPLRALVKPLEQIALEVCAKRQTGWYAAVSQEQHRFRPQNSIHVAHD
jgi:hypothetical protein